MYCVPGGGTAQQRDDKPLALSVPLKAHLLLPTKRQILSHLCMGEKNLFLKFGTYGKRTAYNEAGEKEKEVEFLVDTEATYSVLNKALMPVEDDYIMVKGATGQSEKSIFL